MGWIGSVCFVIVIIVAIISAFHDTQLKDIKKQIKKDKERKTKKEGK